MFKTSMAALVICAAVPGAVWAGAPAITGDQHQAAAAMLQKHGVADIIFAVRAFGNDGHYYANFGYFDNNPRKWAYGRGGGQLCKLNLRTGKVSVLLDDAQGSIRDPCIHYDGRKILFSYRKGGQNHYHLYEIDSDGAKLRQLTDGPYDDIEPIYLPDDRIVFCSSRCNRFVACWYTQVAILYHCDGDGRNIRPLSSSIVHDNTPWMLPDGRILYTRWEYVDRSRVRYHHLWIIRPDGTGQMVYFGNMHGGTVMIDAKPIPDTHKIACIFSPGHGRTEHCGRMTIVDPREGPDSRARARQLGTGSNYHDPYPLSEDSFLLAEDNRILWMNGRGETHVLHAFDRGKASWLRVHEPRPLLRHDREPLLPSTVDLSKATGQLILADIRHGRRMQGVAEGEIKRLLVLEQLPKPVNLNGTTRHNTSIGGTFTLKRILGTVPVEADGSANFEVPALRNIFFVALDKNNLSVKRMQSFVTVQPGETTSCVGCHEHRTDTPRLHTSPTLAAVRRPPSRIEPITDVPDVIDFPRDVQPILDRHCVSCHGGKRVDGKIDLSSTPSGHLVFSRSYHTLMTVKGLVSHGNDADGNRPPRSIGSAASRLMATLLPSHYKVKLSQRDHRLVRLWIETGAAYPGTCAAMEVKATAYHLPDFRPNKHYIREMKRYGILPTKFDLTRDSIDVYATDQAYWQSLWHRPKE